MIVRLRWIAASAVVALAACGGGGGSGPLVPSASPTPLATSTSGASPASNVTFVVTIPSASTNARHRATTSSNTGSIVFTLQSVNGVTSSSAPTVAAIGASAPGCSSAQTGITCNISVPAPPGNDVFAVATYQSSNGTGAALAATNVAVATEVAVPASVTLDLGGIAASLTFSPARLPLVNDGNIHRVAVTINAADASGATIVGAAYQSPVSLQIQNDPAGALSLSTASVSQPGTVVTVTYNSAKPLTQGEIVGSDNAMTSATLIAAPLTISPLPITILDTASATGVSLTEAGFNGAYTVSVANASDANVVVNPGTLGTGTAVANITPKAHFDVTTLNVSDGNVTANVPLAIVPQISSYAPSGRQHQILNGIAMVADASGNLWSSDQVSGSLIKFNPTNGTYTSYVVDPNFYGPLGIAFDASGNLWYADGPQIGEFTPSTATNTTYTTGLEANAFVSDIVAGQNGLMWFYDQATGATYPSGHPTYFGSITTASGTITEYENTNGAGPTQSSMSMVLANDGSVWFADQLNASIGRINTSTGAVTEYATGIPAYPQQSPQQLVVAPSGKIWFAAAGFTSGTSIVGYVDPSNGNAITYNTNLPAYGIFYALTVGSDGNLWFIEDPGTASFISSQPSLGVINPSTGAIYEYTTLLPQFSKVVTLLNGGNGTLWMLDTAYGQVAEVTFK
jgi:streptogramin lyase